MHRRDITCGLRLSIPITYLDRSPKAFGLFMTVAAREFSSQPALMPAGLLVIMKRLGNAKWWCSGGGPTMRGGGLQGGGGASVLHPVGALAKGAIVVAHAVRRV
jgi:hypothetical protein